MKLTKALPSISALMLCTLLFGTAHAANSTIENLQDDLKSYQTQKTTLNQELEFTQFKLKATQEKLADLQRELKIKEIQLDKMKVSIGSTPTAEQKEFIENESNRIELGATAIKSRKAAITRLERKESSIAKKLQRIDRLTDKTNQNIASIKSSNVEAKEQANVAKSTRMNHELEELKKENEQLRLAMAEEAQRARNAIEAKKRLAEQTKEAELALQEAEELAAQKAKELEAAKALAEKRKALLNEDQSQVVLPGEVPIYNRSDGKKVVIRNRGNRESHDMKRVGKRIYAVEVVLESGKTYFDVKRRRYRGYFPGDSEDTYIFTYDLTNEEQPVLSVRRKSDDPTQMISNANDPF